MNTYDSFHRKIDYLRISVTDRCNLRCLYCMPETGITPISHNDILRYEEITQIVKASTKLGISKIRLTGGEPLARLGLVDLVTTLARIPGIAEIAMTTNGTMLEKYAQQLAEAGLSRVNISLDTLVPERFTQITRHGQLDDVLRAIKAAEQYGLTPVKINTVVMRGINDDEVVDLARKTISDGWNLRFIEWMPVGDSAGDEGNWESKMVSENEIRNRVEKVLGNLIEDERLSSSGPARTYRFPGASGTLGFISAISQHFCAQCNRLRLTADGHIRPCLLADEEIDLRTPLRNGATEQMIEELLLQAIHEKPPGHTAVRVQNRFMSQIGG